MELKRKCINTVITVKGFGSVKIENNPDRFEMYKNLGLDVFAKARKPKKADSEEE